jgi:hypothetical protein
MTIPTVHGTNITLLPRGQVFPIPAWHVVMLTNEALKGAVKIAHLGVFI